MSTPDILYIDLELTPKGDFLKAGAKLNGRDYEGASLTQLVDFAKEARFVAGHNLILHDLPWLEKQQKTAHLALLPAIDTLMLSVLLRPDQQRHALAKDYLSATVSANDPLKDAAACQSLLENLVEIYQAQALPFRQVLYAMLHDIAGFAAFFQLFAAPVDKAPSADAPKLMFALLEGKICQNADIPLMQEKAPAELAFILAILMGANPTLFTPSWLRFRYPLVDRVYARLRTTACKDPNCRFCADKLDPHTNMKRYFGYPGFRRFEGDDVMPLQEKAVRAALRDESFLVIFPTGGGKSITFQLPALMRGAATNALTVVISPLVSLMKDQVDNLRSNFDIVTAIAINGLLSPLEREEAVRKVEDGTINLLYLSPESLRSAAMFRLLKSRIIDRFVIDEAHCFSAWGQDFRVDYLYIGRFIQQLQEDTNRIKPIPVSCFTATARTEVVEDIKAYFKDRLQLNMQAYTTAQGRKNLKFRGLETEGDERKDDRLLELLRGTDAPVIIYVSRVKTSENLANKLKRLGFEARAYNGKMDSSDKIEIQEAFKENKIRIIVATSAFGMGVDKDNIALVVHYEISSSLENYQQEAGRAGRKPELSANCVILFDEADLAKHFELLQGTKLNKKEIEQIWQAVKLFKRDHICKSALEIAKKAGWDEEMRDLDTKIRSAINALEEAKYVERLHNSPVVFSNSILPQNLEKAKAILWRNHEKFTPKQLEANDRILQYLFGKQQIQVDYMADATGIRLDEMATILTLFREIGILADEKDLTARLQGKRRKDTASARLTQMIALEAAMLEQIFGSATNFKTMINLRELNSELAKSPDVLLQNVSIPDLRTILRYWKFHNWLTAERTDADDFWYKITRKKEYDECLAAYQSRTELAGHVLSILEKISEEEKNRPANANKGPDQLEFGFSMVGLKRRVEVEVMHSKKNLGIKAYENCLLYLHEIAAIELLGGLLIQYNRLNIERLQKDNKKQYTKEDYKTLEGYYERKIEQVHIVGEYAKRLMENDFKATVFSHDYFTLPYAAFLNKYFSGKKDTLQRPLTEAKYLELFGHLSAEQKLAVIGKEQRMLVAAGPGSGKTMVLVHKMASLLLLEDIKPAQFLMLAFSRPAAQEFKARLAKLVPGLGGHVDIFTYHGLAFRLLGKMGDLSASDNVLKDAATAIREGNAPLEKVAAKSVIMLDEFQDVSADEWDFLQAILEQAGDDTRIIAAGDDDQSIYEFRGASIAHMRALIDQGAALHYLTRNYRAAPNLVAFSNAYLQYLPADRIKSEHPLEAVKKENGGLRILRYEKGSLIRPFVEAVAQNPTQGSRALLTATNEEAALVYAQLKAMDIPAILLSQQKGFSLGQLQEFDWLRKEWQKRNAEDEVARISPKVLNTMLEALKMEFSRSQDLPLVCDAVGAFAAELKRMHLLDWEEYLAQLRMEDILFPDQQKVFVSTMHKAKGKEFDEVFLLLENFNIQRNDEARAVYVAITRARKFLEIHTNRPFFDSIRVDDIAHIAGTGSHQALRQQSFDCGMRDVVLNHFERIDSMRAIQNIQAGDPLIIDQANSGHLLNAKGEIIVKLSKSAQAHIDKLKGQHYALQTAHVSHVVRWFSAAKEAWLMVVLPVLEFKKN